MCEIARSQAARMAKFAKLKRLRRINFENFAMRAAWLRAISHTTPARHYNMQDATAQKRVGTRIMRANSSFHLWYFVQEGREEIHNNGQCVKMIYVY